jgi:hypothetical protein
MILGITIEHFAGNLERESADQASRFCQHTFFNGDL